MQPDIFRESAENFRESAENCALLAEAASTQPTFLGYKRMQAAWLALAHEQDWLDGKIGAVQMHTMPWMAACPSGGIRKCIASDDRKMMSRTASWV
jgi:hypothetical protein